MVSKRRIKYEGSKQDLTEDRRGAARLKLSLKDYEQTKQDKAEDRRGQAKLEKKK